jgi:hypothetical protein
MGQFRFWTGLMRAEGCRSGEAATAHPVPLEGHRRGDLLLPTFATDQWPDLKVWWEAFDLFAHRPRHMARYLVLVSRIHQWSQVS